MVTGRSAVMGVVALLAAASSSEAQGLLIDHRPVACIVAGKYPRLNACFAPSSTLARARVYFRRADATADWFYVEMKSDAPCFRGVLPRPKAELVGQRLLYYVDAVDRKFSSSRTPETTAEVVAREGDCKRGLPIAPWLPKASVAVFPGVPSGFAAAGLGAATTTAVIGGGAAVVGGGVAAAVGGSSGSNAPGASAASSAPTTTAPPTPTTTTTTTTTLAPGGAFVPSFKVYRAGTLQNDVVIGPDPLALVFDMCETTGPFPLRFNVEVEGRLLTAGCRSTITFGANQATAGSTDAASAAALPGSKRYSVLMNIRSEAPNNDPKAQRSLTVEVTSAVTGCSADTQGPVVTLTKPFPGAAYPSPNAYPVRLEAFADDSGNGNNGVKFVQYKVNYPGPDQQVLGPVTSGGPWRFDWSESAISAWIGVPCNRTASIQAYAEDNCGHGTFSSPVTVDVRRVGGGCFLGSSAPSAEGSSGLVSELDVPGGAAQVVVNGEASFPRGGRHPLAFRFTPGANRVEATLVEGRGPGLWRFDLSAAPGLRPESLRVVAGEVVQAAGGIVGFRLRGRSGERVVFTFEID